MARRGDTPAQNKLAATGIAEIARLIASGTSYRQIAKNHGVSIGLFCEWIEADPERSQACARAREMSAQTWDEKSEQCIADAADAFELAKARELAVHYRWRAKAVNPQRYGDRTKVEADINLNADSIIQQVAAAASTATRG